MRVGEITGLRWEDVDFDNNIIHINHTLVYYDTRVLLRSLKIKRTLPELQIS